MDTNYRLKIRGHPREWFVHPEVNITIKALTKLGIKPAAKWKYRCPWNDNAQEEIYPLTHSDLLNLIQNETARVEKERDEHKKSRGKMIFFSSFYVYTRADGPGSPLKFAFHFSREKYRKNKAEEIKRRRSGKYGKPFLAYSRPYSVWHFDEEAHSQKIREMNAEISKISKKETPFEKAEKRWKKVVHQDQSISSDTAEGLVLIYSKPSIPKNSFERDLKITVKKNAEDAEKRKWKAPPQGYQIGVSDKESKEYFRVLFQKSGHEELSLNFLKPEHVQIDIPAALIPKAFEAVRYFCLTLKFNIYKKNRDGYPTVKYCFPKDKEFETSKEAELITLRI
ncbi:MAG: hypothetical protein NTZ13_03045 [Candidatus Parcubacteria bacterium]|nr:hypothetical protein [Candidatus Parcubacteria bacterium]